MTVRGRRTAACPFFTSQLAITYSYKRYSYGTLVRYPQGDVINHDPLTKGHHSPTLPRCDLDAHFVWIRGVVVGLVGVGFFRAVVVCGVLLRFFYFSFVVNTNEYFMSVELL